MGTFICANSQCEKSFFSKHSVARYCSRHCANQANQIQRLRNNGKPKYSDEFLLNHLAELSKQLGRTPSRNEVKCPDAHTYRDRFGSYNNAVIAAGLTPNTIVPVSYLNQERNLVPLSLRYKILKRDGFRCQYCGGTPQEGYTLHVDHKIPRSQGGKAVEDNLIAACILCNQGKSDAQ
jgi:hypothetical protein